MWCYVISSSQRCFILKNRLEAVVDIMFNCILIIFQVLLLEQPLKCTYFSKNTCFLFKFNGFIYFDHSLSHLQSYSHVLVLYDHRSVSNPYLAVSMTLCNRRLSQLSTNAVEIATTIIFISNVKEMKTDACLFENSSNSLVLAILSC